MAANSIMSAGLSGGAAVGGGIANVLAPATGGSHGKPTNAKEAATQFEGMLISEMLQSAHESNSGSLNGDDDSDAESDTAYSMAADQFAQMMAKKGGFGIAKMLTEKLSNAQGTANPAPGEQGHSPEKPAGTPALRKSL